MIYRATAVELGIPPPQRRTRVIRDRKMANTHPSTAFSEEEVQNWFDEEESEQDTALDTDTDLSQKYAHSQLRVVRETKDYQLDYLKHALKPGQELIDTSPEYQRRLRWSRRKRSLLIESFLLNIPIPPIFLFEHDYNEYEVIDGRQRLESIREYLANNFPLIGLEYWPELRGKRFNDLPNVLKKGLLRRSLPAVVLLAETSQVADDELDVRTVLFDRLNTGGEKLNAQELRNALYPGRLNALLIRLARSRPFTDIWNIPEYTEGEETDPPDPLARNTLFKSMADAELVLRFFALRDAIEYDRRGSLRRILDRYMRDNHRLVDLPIDAMQEEYQRLLTRLYNLFDGKPFRLPGANRPSRPLYDALMIALDRNADYDAESDKDNIQSRLQAALKDNDSYDILVGRGNTIDAIHDRVALAETILTGSTAQ